MIVPLKVHWDWEVFKDLIGKEEVDCLQILMTEKKFHNFCQLLSYNRRLTGVSQTAATVPVTRGHTSDGRALPVTDR